MRGLLARAARDFNIERMTDMKKFALLVLAIFAAVSVRAEKDWPSILEAKNIAEEGFISRFCRLATEHGIRPV